MSVIDVKNISKKYTLSHMKNPTVFSHIYNALRNVPSSEEFYALKNVSFSVKKGEVFGIVGRNGSGKTTLLKIISGIIQPTTGSIHTNKRITPFLDMGIGFHDELTARENIFLYGAVMGISRSKLKEQMDSILDFAGVTKFADSKLKVFSSGMVVRLAFSTMIRTTFDVMVLDEIFAVGDEAFTLKCKEVFFKNKKAGKTIVVSTHALHILEEYCDRAMLLDRGRILAIGKPKDIVEKYRSIL